jgi:cytochrome c peroxidase
MKAYRTTPLRGLAQHAPYFHDGSARTLADVIEHYNTVRKLALTDQQKRDHAEYLKTL